MKRIITGGFISFAILTILFSISANVFAAKFFRWVDDNGKTYYSYTLPPDASQKSYTEINKTGIHIESVSVLEKTAVVSDLPPEKTEPEKEVDEAAKKYDNYLLSTYLSVEELKALFLEKQKMLNDQVDLYNVRIAKLEASLITVGEQEKNTKNKVAKEKLKNHLDITANSLKVYKEMVSDNQKKMKHLSDVYQVDKLRLVELLSKDKSKDKTAE